MLGLLARLEEKKAVYPKQSQSYRSKNGEVALLLSRLSKSAQRGEEPKTQRLGSFSSRALSISSSQSLSRNSRSAASTSLS